MVMGGVQRTIDLLRINGHDFPQMREHVREFIRKCAFCQKTSQIKVPIHTNPFTLAAYDPMKRLCIDTIGPLPPDEYENRHIIVIVDSCTRYVRLYPVRSTDAEHAVMALNSFFADFPIPDQIVSDRGTQFVNALVAEYLKLAGITHVKTMAYSKEENALVERANKEVMRHLRAFIFDRRIREHWYKYLPFVTRIINTSIHTSTGVSPSALIFGVVATQDQGIFAEYTQAQRESLTLSKGTANMLKAQQILLKIATENQLKRDSENIAKRTPRAISQFPPDSYVLVEYPDTGLGKKPPNKLMVPLKGPYRVVENVGAEYRLLNLVNNKIEEVHVKRLRPFDFDPNRTDPRDVANADVGFENVERIITHKGKFNRKNTLEFKVHWEGCPDSEDSWLPWKELRSNEALHAYLTRTGHASMIPKEYR